MNLVLLGIILVILYFLFQSDDGEGATASRLSKKLVAAEARNEQLEALRVQFETQQGVWQKTEGDWAEEKGALVADVARLTVALAACEAGGETGGVAEVVEPTAVVTRMSTEGGVTAVVVGQPNEGEGTAVAVAADPDDLRKIEGIGPKFAGLLNEAGVLTFAQLAQLTPAAIRIILAGSGAKGLANPASWPAQAALAAQGDWEGLAALQGELKGGRY